MLASNPMGQINPRVLQEIEKADAIIYGMGSLYTSICPIICLDGMGELVATREIPKVGGDPCSTEERACRCWQGCPWWWGTSGPQKREPAPHLSCGA